MFCLDFVLAFAAHGLLRPRFPGGPAAEFAAGGAAGLAAAAALYPFDLLRQSAVQRGASSFAASTVPFMAVYLGVFFSAIPPDAEAEISAKAAVALAASTAAAAVEFPLDKAKHAIAGGHRGMAIATSAARIPLSAFMLLAYEHILRARILKD